MSRHTIVMVAGAAVVVAGAIALAIMTRSEPALLKAEPHAAREPAIATMSASTSTSPQNSSVAAPSIQAREVAATDDVAELGNGSSGELLQRLADQYAQHHWPDAMAACLNPDVAVAGAKLCAISACELHDTLHARRFFARVTGADRAAVRAECESVHIPVERTMRPWLGTHRRPLRSPMSAAGSGG